MRNLVRDLLPTDFMAVGHPRAEGIYSGAQECRVVMEPKSHYHQNIITTLNTYREKGFMFSWQ
jgi:hypothetical protein